MAVVTSLVDMQVGDKIICRYTATSNAFGTFSELGTSQATLIPAASSATPDGSFYFICVGKDNRGRLKLVADRNIQHSISWDVLNNAMVATAGGVTAPFADKLAPVAGGVASASGQFNDQAPARAFDGVVAYDNMWQTSVVPAWLSYEFPAPVILTKYTIVGHPNITDRFPYNFTIEGWDGSQWVVIDTQTGQSVTTAGQQKTYTFNNSRAFIKYRINVTATSYGAGSATNDYCAISEWGLFGKAFDTPMNVRLLTGGVSATDKDNEWDAIVVGSTLNGTITAGADAVWNWSGATLRSLTSTANPSNNAQRVARGYSTLVDAYNVIGTATSTGYGFRPVLLVELPPPPPPTKFLVQDGTGIKTYSGGWQVVGQAPATEAMFLASGVLDPTEMFNNLDTLTSDDIQVLYYTTTPTEPVATVIPKAKMVLPTGDININGVLGVDHFTLTASGNVKVLVSVDQGVTWNTFNSGWAAVDPTDLTTVEATGMTVTTLNALTSIEWTALLGASKTIRFAYYLDIDASTDVAETDSLVGQFDMQGWWEGAVHGIDYGYRYPNNTSLQVRLYADGTYKINYQDSVLV